MCSSIDDTLLDYYQRELGVEPAVRLDRIERAGAYRRRGQVVQIDGLITPGTTTSSTVIAALPAA